jgi:MFS family permease
MEVQWLHPIPTTLSQNTHKTEPHLEIAPVDEKPMASPTNSTTIELENIPADSPEANLATSGPFDPARPDTVIQASRIADSQAPDGGYGWVVIFACSILTFWFVGTSYSWGVLQAALAEKHLSSPSTLAFIGSLTAACISALAIINARVIRWMGARNTALLGVALLGLGGVLSGFSTEDVGGLFVTTGIIEGIGTRYVPKRSILRTPGSSSPIVQSNVHGMYAVQQIYWELFSYYLFKVVSVTPAQYFNKKRGLANGIVYAGGGLGGTIISFAMDGLLQNLGPGWTFRIIGLMTLITGLPAAWLIKERAPITTSIFIEWYVISTFWC